MRIKLLIVTLIISTSFILTQCGVLFDLNLTADVTSGPAPLTVKFTADTEGYVGIIEYYWDFDDGEISLEKNPTHIFTEPGIHSVTCEASTDDSDKSSSIEIEVTEP